MRDPVHKSPFDINNIRRFIAFRVFFNARFYYPVFTILFLDFGLTLQQFALLNAAWAAAIVIFEVPSGALADTIGRRRLMISTGILMVVEISLLCFVPMGDLQLLFTVFLVNRIISGAAEAMASGADEALAYDTLKREGNVGDWGRVLEKQMRIQSMVRIGAMSVGAAVYDPALMQRLADWLGLNITLTQDITIRFPLFLTLVLAIMTLITTVKMDEITESGEGKRGEYQPSRESIFHALKVTLNAGRWILKTPLALVIIVMGLFFDSTIRMLGTMNSQYFRLIHLPESSFGLISAGISILGVFIPYIALKLVNHRSPTFNLGIMAVLTLLGLTGMTYFLPIIGLIPVVILSSVMYLLGFFMSHYLNQITSSDQRATVLSFKGLSFNLAYGLIGVFYSFFLAFLRPQFLENKTGISADHIENLVFMESITWFPWYFIFLLSGLLIFARWRLQNSDR